MEVHVDLRVVGSIDGGEWLMRTYPIQGAGGTIVAFEIDAQIIGLRLARVLRRIEAVSDVRRRRWWVGLPDVHLRFLYLGREYVVWEPFGDNSRWWVGPEDTGVPHPDISGLERAVAAA